MSSTGLAVAVNRDETGESLKSVVLKHKEVLARGLESGSADWEVWHAIGGYRLTAIPVGNAASMSRLLHAVWPLLSHGGIEIRWLGQSGRTECALLMRATGEDANLAVAELEIRLTTLDRLRGFLLQGWVLERLEEDGLTKFAEPFDVAEGGDLLRQELEIEHEDQSYDVPFPYEAGRFGLDYLVEALAWSQAPTVLSLAARPTHIDEAEHEVLHRELADLEVAVMPSLQSLERAQDYVDAPSVINAAATLLRNRVADVDRLGFMRVSLASSGPLYPETIAAAIACTSAVTGGSRYVPAAEEADLQIFQSNLLTMGFEPWGVQAEEQHGHESVNDCYLASISEVIEALRVPDPNPLSSLAIEMVDPAPRSVPNAIPTQGRQIGTGVSDRKREIALSDADRLRHTYVVGQTGTGKSTLLLNLVLDDIHAGLGCCVIDPHGDLIDEILLRYPRERAEDLVLFDPTSESRTIGLNPLDAGTTSEKDFVIQQIINMLYRVYDPGHTGIIGPRFEHWFRNAAMASMSRPEGGALVDIPRLLTDDSFLAGVMKHVTDPTVRDFFIRELGATSDFHKSEVLGWFTAKFGAFISNTSMRRILSQRQSTIHVGDIMDSGKVLLVKLPRGVIGEINAMWLGMILITKIQMQALSRASRPSHERKLFCLYVDEFQSFAHTDFDQVIAEARKYGLSLTLAHQHVAQLPGKLRDAVFGNIGSWLLFRTGLTDGELLERETEGFSARDLSRLPNYRCVVRTAVDGRPTPAFDIWTYGPDRFASDPEAAESMQQLAMLKHGRSVDVVDMEYEMANKAVSG